MDTAIIDVTTETPEAATACEAATPPAPLVHIGNFSGARGLRLSPLSVRIDAPAHVAAMERLKDQLAAEEALESEECYLSGRISRCVGLGLFAVSAPAGVV